MELIPLGAALVREGLIRRAEGSLSFRDGERLLVTAATARLGQMEATDLVALSLNGQRLAADEPAPTAEWTLHVAAHQARPKDPVVVHAHPRKAVALSLLGRALPPLTPEQYLHLGNAVPLVPYDTPTTRALAERVAAALKVAPAALLQNHGIVVCAGNAQQALRRAIVLEESCALYLDALASGEPAVLTAEQQRALDEITEGRYRR